MIAKDRSHPSGMRRSLTFVVYGLAVGALYAMAALSCIPNILVARLVAALLVLAMGLLSWNVAQADKRGNKDPLLIALAPLGFVVAIFVMVVLLVVFGCVLPFFAARGMWMEQRFRRELRKQGRLITAAELTPRLVAGEGTLMEEMGHKGTYRIWWTEDEIAALQAEAPPTDRFVELLHGRDEGGFNAFCLREYVGHDGGKAVLTPIPARSEKLEREFPRMKRIIFLRV